jgi:predicted O-methyltransferase YrrM
VDASRSAIAAEILAEAREHDERQADRLDRFRSVEPQTAQLLNVLVRATRARAILEIGTSNGYSTIWLADGGGAVTSVDIDAHRTELARANLARAGVEAELRTEDAAATLATADDGAYDLIFLDSERPAYAGYWPDLLRVLRADGGLLVIDNVVSHAHEVVEITALIDDEPSVASVLVEIGAGILVVTHCG